MKNMFFVINKEKIYAYVVSIMTIVTIFFMSSLINSDIKETEVTSSKTAENNAIGEAISTSTPYDDNKDNNNASHTIAENTSENEDSNYTEQINENTESNIIEKNEIEESGEQ